MQVIVDGLLVNYRKTGKGKVILGLHGWGDSSLTFSRLGETLAKQYTLLTPDLPGLGASQAPSAAWGLEDYATFAAAFLKKLKIAEPYAIIGHSNGGAITVCGLASGQLAADRLVLLASAGIRNRQSARRLLFKAVAKSGKLAATPLPRAAQKKLRARFYGAIGSDLILLPQMEETFRKIVTQDIQNNAAKISLPTLLIYGANDKQTPPTYGRLLNQAIPNSKLEIIQGAGHFLHQEKAATVGAIISDFLSGPKAAENA